MGQIDTVRKIRSEKGNEILPLTQQFCIFLGRQGNVVLSEEDSEDAAQ
ncbi:hypothetical protein HY312_04205 [Candidatus Saccharibacteria bacterium]|nr:hypothetical protein [Candidatus Saccharibacteria bacterium]